MFFRSTKYSAMMLETPSAPAAPPPPVTPSVEPQQPCSEEEPPLGLSSTQIQPLACPAATSSPQQESLSRVDEESLSLDDNQDSGPMLCLSESLQESLTADEVVRNVMDSGLQAPAALSDETQAAVIPDSRPLLLHPDPGAPPAKCGNTESTETGHLQQQHAKLKKDRLTRLKELGLVPPPVAKLCPDDGAFIQLEPPQPNPGESSFPKQFQVEQLLTYICWRVKIYRTDTQIKLIPSWWLLQ